MGRKPCTGSFENAIERSNVMSVLATLILIITIVYWNIGK